MLAEDDDDNDKSWLFVINFINRLGQKTCCGHFSDPDANLLVGRGDQCYIRLTSLDISREHCRLKMEPSKFVSVTALSSAAETKINGITVNQDQTQIIQNHDKFLIGSKTFHLEYSSLCLSLQELARNENFEVCSETAIDMEKVEIIDVNAVIETGKKRDTMDFSTILNTSIPAVKAIPSYLKATVASMARQSVPTKSFTPQKRNLAAAFAMSSKRSRLEHPPSIQSHKSPLDVNNPLGKYFAELRSGSAQSTRKLSELFQPFDRSEIVSDTVQDEKKGSIKSKSLIKSFSMPARVSSPLASRKAVKFGPALSPEIFDHTEPTNTPLKRGRHPTKSHLASELPEDIASLEFSTPIKQRQREDDIGDSLIKSPDHQASVGFFSSNSHLKSQSPPRENAFEGRDTNIVEGRRTLQSTPLSALLAAGMQDPVSPLRKPDLSSNLVAMANTGESLQSHKDNQSSTSQRSRRQSITASRLSYFAAKINTDSMELDTLPTAYISTASENEPINIQTPQTFEVPLLKDNAKDISVADATHDLDMFRTPVVDIPMDSIIPERLSFESVENNPILTMLDDYTKSTVKSTTSDASNLNAPKPSESTPLALTNTVEEKLEVEKIVSVAPNSSDELSTESPKRSSTKAVKLAIDTTFTENPAAQSFKSKLVDGTVKALGNRLSRRCSMKPLETSRGTDVFNRIAVEPTTPIYLESDISNAPDRRLSRRSLIKSMEISVEKELTPRPATPNHLASGISNAPGGRSSRRSSFKPPQDLAEIIDDYENSIEPATSINLASDASKISGPPRALSAKTSIGGAAVNLVEGYLAATAIIPTNDASGPSSDIYNLSPIVPPISEKEVTIDNKAEGDTYIPARGAHSAQTSTSSKLLYSIPNSGRTKTIKSAIPIHVASDLSKATSSISSRRSLKSTKLNVAVADIERNAIMSSQTTPVAATASTTASPRLSKRFSGIHEHIASEQLIVETENISFNNLETIDAEESMLFLAQDMEESKEVLDTAINQSVLVSESILEFKEPIVTRADVDNPIRNDDAPMLNEADLSTKENATPILKDFGITEASSGQLNMGTELSVSPLAKSSSPREFSEYRLEMTNNHPSNQMYRVSNVYDVNCLFQNDFENLTPFDIEAEAEEEIIENDVIDIPSCFINSQRSLLNKDVARTQTDIAEAISNIKQCSPQERRATLESAGRKLVSWDDNFDPANDSDDDFHVQRGWPTDVNECLKDQAHLNEDRGSLPRRKSSSRLSINLQSMSDADLKEIHDVEAGNPTIDMGETVSVIVNTGRSPQPLLTERITRRSKRNIVLEQQPSEVVHKEKRNRIGAVVPSAKELIFHEPIDKPASKEPTKASYKKHTKKGNLEIDDLNEKVSNNSIVPVTQRRTRSGKKSALILQDTIALQSDCDQHSDLVDIKSVPLEKAHRAKASKDVEQTEMVGERVPVANMRITRTKSKEEIPVDTETSSSVKNTEDIDPNVNKKITQVKRPHALKEKRYFIVPEHYSDEEQGDAKQIAEVSAAKAETKKLKASKKSREAKVKEGFVPRRSTRSRV